MADSKHKQQKKFLLDLDSAGYLSIFDHFSDGVIATDAGGVIVYYNTAMARIDELTPDKVLSCKITALWHSQF